VSGSDCVPTRLPIDSDCEFNDALLVAALLAYVAVVTPVGMARAALRGMRRRVKGNERWAGAGVEGVA